MEELNQQFPWPKLIKFVVIGGGAFVIDFGIYHSLTRLGHWSYLSSRTVSILVSMTWNFFLNRYWTFQAGSGPIGRQLTRFTLVMVATSLLSLVLVRLGVVNLHLNDLLVFVVVSGLIMVINFILHQFWSYAD